MPCPGLILCPTAGDGRRAINSLATVNCRTPVSKDIDSIMKNAILEKKLSRYDR